MKAIQLLVLSFALSFCGCAAVEANSDFRDAFAGASRAGAECSGGTNWAVLLDLSGSVTDAHRAGWAKTVDTHIGPRLKGCDSIRVIGVHEASTTAAFLLHEEIAGPRDAESIRVRLESQRKIQAMRGTLQKAIAAASAGEGGATRTDLLGALDRVGTTGGRPTCILVFSDALHVDGDLNMERTPLAGRIDEYVRKEMNRRGWSSEQFRNAGMVVVRPPARGVDKRPNDLITLRNFWGSLMAAAGGRLLSMDTDIPKQVWSKEEK